MGMLGYKTAFEIDAEGVDDRAYRLSRHAGQATVDRFSAVGALAGAAVGSVLGRQALRSVAATASMGCGAGVLVYLAQTYGDQAPQLLARTRQEFSRLTESWGAGGSTGSGGSTGGGASA